MFEVCVKGVERKLVDEKEGVWWEDVQVRLLGVYVSSSRDRLVAFFSRRSRCRRDMNLLMTPNPSKIKNKRIMTHLSNDSCIADVQNPHTHRLHLHQRRKHCRRRDQAHLYRPARCIYLCSLRCRALRAGHPTTIPTPITITTMTTVPGTGVRQRLSRRWTVLRERRGRAARRGMTMMLMMMMMVMRRA